MAFYESSKVGVDESLIVKRAFHGSGINQSLSAETGGFYQLIYGGTTSQSGGGTIEVYYKASDSQQEVLVDSVSIPMRSSSTITGLEVFSTLLNRSDELVVKTTGTGTYKIFVVFQKLG